VGVEPDSDDEEDIAIVDRIWEQIRNEER